VPRQYGWVSSLARIGDTDPVQPADLNSRDYWRDELRHRKYPRFPGVNYLYLLRSGVALTSRKS
jgi:hypothetical protein